jgi:flagellin
METQMSSINTNMAAMTALQSLAQTQQDMTTTQNRISTGLRVSQASDNAAYWSIATTMRSDVMSLSTVQDALGLGASQIGVAYTGINSAIDVVDQIKAKLVAAKQPGIDRNQVQTEIKSLQDQLKNIADSASFSGDNWLSVDTSSASYNASKGIVSSFSRTGGVASVQSITIDTTGKTLFNADASATNANAGIIDAKRAADGSVDQAAGTFSLATLNISSLTDSTADQATLDSYIKGADAGIASLTSAGASFGAAKSRVTMQESFVKSLTDAINSGISSLVDADMNAESSKLQALQVKQQLGVQALSIANSSNQMILKLFQ